MLRGRNRNSSVPYLRSSSPVRSSEKLPSKRDVQPPITPASPRASGFASSSSRNLSVPAPRSPSVHESARPSTPKANGTGIPPQNGLTPSPTVDPILPPLMPTLVTEEVRERPSYVTPILY